MSDLMDQSKVEALIGAVCDAVKGSGCNLLEAHQALKSVDAVLLQQMRENAPVAGGGHAAIPLD